MISIWCRLWENSLALETKGTLETIKARNQVKAIGKETTMTTLKLLKKIRWNQIIFLEARTPNQRLSFSESMSYFSEEKVCNDNVAHFGVEYRAVLNNHFGRNLNVCCMNLNNNEIVCNVFARVFLTSVQFCFWSQFPSKLFNSEQYWISNIDLVIIILVSTSEIKILFLKQKTIAFIYRWTFTKKNIPVLQAHLWDQLDWHLPLWQPSNNILLDFHFELNLGVMCLWILLENKLTYLLTYLRCLISKHDSFNYWDTDINSSIHFILIHLKQLYGTEQSFLLNLNDRP